MSELIEAELTDCWDYDGKKLCEECGVFTQEELHDGSGYPAIFWLDAKSCDYPCRGVGDAAALCADCGKPLGGEP